MKQFLALTGLFLFSIVAGQAATLPIYINNSPSFTATNIDAVAWLNRAYFSIATPTGLPFESKNTRFFTNGPSSFSGPFPAGTMSVTPGLRFFRNTGGQRHWMDTWVNQGSISTYDTRSFNSGGTTFLINDSTASILHVAATNITSTGPLYSGAHGLIRIEGNNINLRRNSLRTGDSQGFFGSLSSVGQSNYLNDVGVRDLDWGGWEGDAVAADRRRGMRSDGTSNPTLTLPAPSSTLHEVFRPSSSGSGIFTSSYRVPGSFLSGTNQSGGSGSIGYTAAVHTATLTATSRLVQVVFYPTNGADTNFSTDVRFYDVSGGNGPSIAVVGFHSTDFDIATQSQTTDSVYLVDGLAVITNNFFARNNAGLTRRPITYAVTRFQPSEYTSGSPGNGIYSDSLFSSSNMPNVTVTNRYAAYAASVGLRSSSDSGVIPYGVTNLPGRVEIIGDTVNLDQTRIRAESALIVKANNLTSNLLAQVDAPTLNFDVGSKESSLVISNLAPPFVRRLNGSVAAWSAVWQNTESVQTGTNTSTNSVIFHVLIVESLLSAQVPVTVNEFSVRATNVVIHDALSIGSSFKIEGNAVHFVNGLTLPFGADLSTTSLVNVRNFTNDGVITVAGLQSLGADRTLSYSNYVNRGTNIAATVEIRTRNFENPGLLAANGGLLSIDAVNATLVGPPLEYVFSLITNEFGEISFSFEVTQQPPEIDGASDVLLHARDLTVSNSIINAGTLILSVTNHLNDGGSAGGNTWNVTGGFNFARKPATGDLSGTELRSTSPRLGQVFHYSSATNAGNSSAGFTNNLALSKLILDGGEGSFFRFQGNGVSNAIYVDFLELQNYATNFNSMFGFEPNVIIYFANANVPASKLDGAAGGGFRWVSTHAGPLSSTNIVYPSGSNYTFNIALVLSKDLDSDGDGIVNSDDETPIYVAESAMLSLTLAPAPDLRALLTWNALAYSSNYLEFKTSASETNWQILTNFHMGPLTWPVSVDDPINATGAARVYRLRVDPGPY